MISIGIRLPRKSRDKTRTLRARVLMCFVLFGELLCEHVNVDEWCVYHVVCVVKCCVLKWVAPRCWNTFRSFYSV